MATININKIKLTELLQIIDINGKKKLNNGDNKLEGNQGKKIKNYRIKTYNTAINIILLIIIKSIIISNLFYRMESNIYDLGFFQDSQITLKIKGKEENKMFNVNFKGINSLKEVHINGQTQNGIPNKYNFDQEYNSVELILDDNIDNTENMFKDCASITEINLSAFDSSKVTSIDNMFEGCSSLTSIDLSNLKTSSVKRMNFMFSGCSSLISLNLSYFDTSSVTRMDSMFSHCSSLTSLDLSNFNVSSLTAYDSMFYDCNNLEYINLYNFTEIKLRPNIFVDSPNNLIICINNITNITFYSSLNDTYYYTYKNAYYNAYYNKSYYNTLNDNCFTVDCSDDWKTRQKKLIKNNNKCIESCNNSQQYQYEYNGKCYGNCPKGLLNNNINKECKCELDKCLTCPPVALKHGLCTECNTNYYPIENDESNLGEYFGCYKNPEGYYLDNNIYKKCYNTCKTCDKEGNETNHNCIICNPNFLYAIKQNDIINCYSTCPFDYYYYEENNYYCTKDSSCPEAYPKLKKKAMNAHA